MDDKALGERVAALESEIKATHEVVIRIEGKLDDDLNDHVQRIARLESGFGSTTKIALVLYTTIVGAIAYLFKRGG